MALTVGLSFRIAFSTSSSALGAAPAACDAEQGSWSQLSKDVILDNYLGGQLSLLWCAQGHVAEHGPELQGTQVTERVSPLPKNSPKSAHLNLNHDLTEDITVVLPPGLLPELQTAAIDSFRFHSTQVTAKNRVKSKKDSERARKDEEFYFIDILWGKTKLTPYKITL